MNADPEVMEFFPGTLNREESDEAFDRRQAHFGEHGWGQWAVELRATGEFIGLVGLQYPRAKLPCSPCVDVGWRLARSYWGKGYASEGARGAFRIGFERLNLPEIVSFTALPNYRSRAVMERIGMRDTGVTFKHPHIPEGHALREHCLYRIAREEWLRTNSNSKD